MCQKQLVATNEVGLFARPATFFIQEANKYQASINIVIESRRVNAKSLLGVLSLGITKGTSFTLEAEGPDEQEALDALEGLVNSTFF